MTTGTAACAYLAETARAYAEYETEITEATAGAGARWHRKIRRAARRYARATAINGGNEMTMTTRTARSLVTTAGCAALAAAALTSAAIPASASAQAPRCRTGQVAVTLEHPVRQGGNEGWTIGLQDKGNAACTVSGYPRLGLEGRHGQRLRSTTQDGPTYFHAVTDSTPRVMVTVPLASTSVLCAAAPSVRMVSECARTFPEPLTVPQASHATANPPGCKITGDGPGSPWK